MTSDEKLLWLRANVGEYDIANIGTTSYDRWKIWESEPEIFSFGWTDNGKRPSDDFSTSSVEQIYDTLNRLIKKARFNWEVESNWVNWKQHR